MPVITQTRPTSALIDLDALAFNFQSSKQFIGSGLKYMAVVKADAYGHGAPECALRLEAEGVDWFGVAIPEEGVELRQAGITRPILCLGSFWPGQEELIVEHHLTPVIFDEHIADLLNRHAASAVIDIDIHVKIDTGMGRVGVRYERAAEFAATLKRFENLHVNGLMTHFASAENPPEDEFTRQQVVRFNSAVDQFRDAGHSPEWIDLANSPGAIRHPDSRGNLVRLGGALYGLLDDILHADTNSPELKPVLSLRSEIAHIKQITAGESLGYGRTFFTKRDSLIALVPVGYADGYPRNDADCGHVCVHGQTAPVVGRISMDWTLIDVTDIADAAVGDEVLLIGSSNGCSITAADIAKEIDTIGYEITCGISPRVPRIFKEKQ
ncbi:MAG: alanine racemase [Chloracidobacterium sp.]|nr:alanine racemase [Chloracidobacterium sp.]